MGSSASGSLFDQCRLAVKTERTCADGPCFCDGSNDQAAGADYQIQMKDPALLSNSPTKPSRDANIETDASTAPADSNDDDDEEGTPAPAPGAVSRSTTIPIGPMMSRTPTNKGTPTCEGDLSEHQGCIKDLPPKVSTPQSRKSSKRVPKKLETPPSSIQVDEVPLVEVMVLKPVETHEDPFRECKGEDDVDAKFKEAGVFRFRSSKANSSCAIVKEDSDEELTGAKAEEK